MRIPTFKTKCANRDQPRQCSRKTTSSPPLTGTPKSQLFIKQPLVKKTRTHQKRSSTTKDIKKEPQQDREEGQSHSIVKSHTPRWATHKQENNYIAEVPPQEVKGLSPISGSPEHLVLKVSGACFQESQRAGGSGDSSLKGHTQNLTLQDPGQKQ